MINITAIPGFSPAMTADERIALRNSYEAKRQAKRVAVQEARQLMEKWNREGLAALSLSDFKYSEANGLTIDGMPAEQWIDAMTKE